MTRTVSLAIVVMCAACMQPAVEAPPAILFAIDSGFGEESNWVGEHLEASADVLVRLMASPEVAPPGRIEVVLVNDPEGDHHGWATPEAIGYVGDRFPKETPYVWILTHELTNLFAAHYGGHGGFPSDWWSNGRSPFPAYLSGLVLLEVGCTEAAEWLRSSSASEPDHVLFWTLHERFGFELFAETLRLLRRDGLDLGEIEPPWPAPNATRTAYTVAYLSTAAGENLTATITASGVGRKPVDWDQNHLELPFEEYVVTPSEVEGIQAAREQAFGPAGSDRARALYRAGQWPEALAEAEPGRLRRSE